MALTMAAGLSAFALPACQGNTTNQTVVVNGLDCGLIRADVAGDWSVTYTAGGATLVGCDTPAFNGRVIDVTGVTTVYSNPVSFASPSGAAFNVVGPGPNNHANELIASVEADSCLALVQTWEEDDSGWVQCFGTMDLATNLISGVCDSFDLDSNADGVADVACGLDHSLLATISTPP